VEERTLQRRVKATQKRTRLQPLRGTLLDGPFIRRVFASIIPNKVW
jgi:hypothetical protein